MNTVFVLMSHYNGSLYLSNQVKSILNQKDIAVKLFIRDDGSSDNNAIDLLRDFEKTSSITVYYGENMGYGRSFMELVKLVPKDADYYAFSDQDDVWKEDKLSVALNYLNGHKEPSVYSALPKYVDKNLRPTNSFYSYTDALPSGVKSVKHALVTHLFGLGCTMVWNKALCELMAKGDYKNLTCGHDNLVSVLAPLVGTYFKDDRQVFFYRQHGKNIGADKSKKSLISNIKHAWTNISNPSPYELRKIIYQNFANAIPTEHRQMLYYTVDYRKHLSSKIKLLSLHLSSGLPHSVRMKYLLKVLVNKY